VEDDRHVEPLRVPTGCPGRQVRLRGTRPGPEQSPRCTGLTSMQARSAQFPPPAAWSHAPRPGEDGRARPRHVSWSDRVRCRVAIGLTGLVGRRVGLCGWRRRGEAVVRRRWSAARGLALHSGASGMCDASRSGAHAQRSVPVLGGFVGLSAPILAWFNCTQVSPFWGGGWGRGEVLGRLGRGLAAGRTVLTGRVS
jgi:hypothetical protein